MENRGKRPVVAEQSLYGFCINANRAGHKALDLTTGHKPVRVPRARARARPAPGDSPSSETTAAGFVAGQALASHAVAPAAATAPEAKEAWSR
jgi:hypothetical protein